MLIGDQWDSASPHYPSPAWPANWSARMDPTGQQYSLLILYLVLLVAWRGRLIPFPSACSFARLTQTGATAPKIQSQQHLAKRQSNKKAHYFCPSGSLRHDRPCRMSPSKSAAICYKNSRCIFFFCCPEENPRYCVAQNTFLLTSQQMKIASHTTTGKEIATSPVPHILLNEMSRLQSSFHKSNGLPHIFSQKE